MIAKYPWLDGALSGRVTRLRLFAKAGLKVNVDGADLELLARRAQQGDEAAARALFREVFPHIRRIAAQALGADSELDDVCQTAALELFKSLPGFRGESRFSTWLYRLVLNVCMQHRRQAKRRATPSDPAIWNEILHDPKAGPEQRALSGERVTLLRRILAEMAPKKRLVFIMHDVEGVELEDVAERLGVNRLTVKSRLFYARREFVKRLKQLDMLESARGESVRLGAKDGEWKAEDEA